MKSNEKQTLKNLETIVDNTFAELIDKIFYKFQDKYVLFNKYSITRENGAIVVHRRQDNQLYKFGVMRNAVIYCMLDHTKMFTEAKRIRVLDAEASSVEIDKQIHTKLKNCTDYTSHVIYSNKLQFDIHRQKRIAAEIDKYTIMANKCHQQGIKNELNGNRSIKEKAGSKSSKRAL
jgi:hypothetical protein